MSKNSRITLALVIAIIMLACNALATGGSEQPPTSTPFISTIPPLPTATPTDVPVQPVGNVVFSDDFSAPSLEMESYSSEEGSAGTENGVYVVRATGSLWQWGKSQSEFADVIIDVDANMASGPLNNNVGFGVICRLSTRDDTSVDGYMLAISADGYYTIRSITASSMSPLVDWTYSDTVAIGTATNSIRATCSGTQLSLEVNGTLIASANTIPDGSASGAVAFSAISFETDNPFTEVHFDNLVVSQP